MEHSIRPWLTVVLVCVLWLSLVAPTTGPQLEPPLESAIPVFAFGETCATVQDPTDYIAAGIWAICPEIADVLDRYSHSKRGVPPGALSLLLIAGTCESGGDRFANERAWGTYSMSVWGYFSHRRRYWPARSDASLGRPGVIDDPADDIKVAVWLLMSGKDIATLRQATFTAPWRHWDGCWPTINRRLDRAMQDFFDIYAPGDIWRGWTDTLTGRTR